MYVLTLFFKNSFTRDTVQSLEEAQEMFRKSGAVYFRVFQVSTPKKKKLKEINEEGDDNV